MNPEQIACDSRGKLAKAFPIKIEKESLTPNDEKLCFADTPNRIEILGHSGVGRRRAKPWFVCA